MSTLHCFSENDYMFRLHLKDKNENKYSMDQPETFLSQRSIDRRIRQGIAIDSTDIPVSEKYLSLIEAPGSKVISQSKWLNTVCVLLKDSLSIDNLKGLDFIENVEFVWKSKNDTTKNISDNKKTVRLPQPKANNKYGYSYDQIKMINGDTLHENGFRGKGIEIAIIDGGFQNLREILLLDNVHLKGTKDFVYDGEDMFKSSAHGLNVLSVLATNRPNIYIGTAPDAKYWLFRSEDSRSEFPIEQDYWVAAVEYADSVGVDIINTSLGYTKFDTPATSYTHADLDGKTAFISKAAKIATQKGIFLEISAGNEGAKTWNRISVPADVDDVLTVGSIKRDSTLSYFSSVGPTTDNRTKPDVVALGDKINVIGGDGDVTYSSGTSFSGPVMTGMAACLWQAYPLLTNIELLNIIRRSGDRSENPNERYGYGIPDIKKVMMFAKELSENKIKEKN